MQIYYLIILSFIIPYIIHLSPFVLFKFDIAILIVFQLGLCERKIYFSFLFARVLHATTSLFYPSAVFFQQTLLSLPYRVHFIISTIMTIFIKRNRLPLIL